jgi:hypothetical protein
VRIIVRGWSRASARLSSPKSGEREGRPQRLRCCRPGLAAVVWLERFTHPDTNMDEAHEQWQLSEIRNGSETMLIRKKLNANAGRTLSGKDYVIFLTFGLRKPKRKVGFYTEEDSTILSEIDETDIPNLERTTGAELVAAVSAWRVRDYIFYSVDPNGFLDAAAYLRDRFPRFQIGCECKPDPAWEQYAELPPAT